MDKILKITTLESMIIHYSHACVIRTPLPLDLYKNFQLWKQLHKNGNIIICGNNSPLLSTPDIECLSLLIPPQPPVTKMY